MDNATNNDTMMVELQVRLAEKGIAFSAKDARMRCLPHVIHLAALELLNAIDGTTTRQEAQRSEGPDGYQEIITEPIELVLDDDGDSPLDLESLAALDSVIPAIAKVQSICHSCI